MPFRLAIILTILSVATGFFLWQYVFNIYEVKYDVTTSNLYADGKSTVTITAQPINALGFEAPFRDIKATFYVEQGHSLIERLTETENVSQVKFRAKDKAGWFIIEAECDYALLPTRIEIQIHAYPGKNLT